MFERNEREAIRNVLAILKRDQCRDRFVKYTRIKASGSGGKRGTVERMNDLSLGEWLYIHAFYPFLQPGLYFQTKYIAHKSIHLHFSQVVQTFMNQRTL